MLRTDGKCFVWLLRSPWLMSCSCYWALNINGDTVLVGQKLPIYFTPLYFLEWEFESLWRWSFTYSALLIFPTSTVLWWEYEKLKSSTEERVLASLPNHWDKDDVTPDSLDKVHTFDHKWKILVQTRSDARLSHILLISDRLSFYLPATFKELLTHQSVHHITPGLRASSTLVIKSQFRLPLSMLACYLYALLPPPLS